MKFGKRLKKQIEETLPQWRDKFLSYKELKKLVRQISAAPASAEAEAEFVRLLDEELDKLNSFFEEQEEEFIIKQKELQERIQRVINGSMEEEEEMAVIRKELVDFHGEMVLLENYSSVNYTGLAKILKKYDKRTGALLRLPFIEKVLQQPFFMTEMISELVKECESTMEVVFPAAEELAERGEMQANAAAEQSIFRSTVAALVTMQELRNGSSTYGHFSLPPLNLPENDFLKSFQVLSPIPIP
ncbi:uncharacterized protein A4U43_C03F13210 [Asparagus officinalis]|uniref:SPX domain-containing protein n=1 Tax=Asparagus officinalis TaxID=4686 RepID=A0A5P1FEV5_ASPOF|nr:SPX domain-containing protein 3-like [Asparagus officinalis]ONK75090.1 uncharacterized protein A4U43_C03F13210 [Asparagus officinalis]